VKPGDLVRIGKYQTGIWEKPYFSIESICLTTAFPGSMCIVLEKRRIPHGEEWINVIHTSLGGQITNGWIGSRFMEVLQ
jgi:hypothetical protein